MANIETIIETGRGISLFCWVFQRSLKWLRNIPTFLANQRLSGQFFAGTFAERIGNVETGRQGILSHLGMTDFNGLDPATLPEHGGNGCGMVELTKRSEGMALTPEQMRMLQIADQMGEAPQGINVICPGFHFCPDWEFLPICQDSPEWEVCTCEKSPTKG